MITVMLMMEQRLQPRSVRPKLPCKEIVMILARIWSSKDLIVDDLVEVIGKKVERKSAIYKNARLPELSYDTFLILIELIAKI
jgi:hypothetical protein